MMAYLCMCSWSCRHRCHVPEFLYWNDRCHAWPWQQYRSRREYETHGVLHLFFLFLTLIRVGVRRGARLLPIQESQEQAATSAHRSLIYTIMRRRPDACSCRTHYYQATSNQQCLDMNYHEVWNIFGATAMSTQTQSVRVEHPASG